MINIYDQVFFLQVIDKNSFFLVGFCSLDVAQNISLEENDSIFLRVLVDEKKKNILL